MVTLEGCRLSGEHHGQPRRGTRPKPRHHTVKPHQARLALGGGAAHVGVLRALAKRDIRPEIVTGTSAGALVGGAFAADLPLDLIEEKVRAANWATFGKLTLAPRLALLDTSVLSESVSVLGENPRIESLPRRFGAVATDVRTRSAVVLTDGPLDLALRASIAVPGLFAPSPGTTACWSTEGSPNGHGRMFSAS